MNFKNSRDYLKNLWTSFRILRGLPRLPNEFLDFPQTSYDLYTDFPPRMTPR